MPPDVLSLDPMTHASPLQPPPLPVRLAQRPPAQTGAIGVLDELLRDRTAFLARLELEAEQARIVRTMILAILCFGAAYGASVGAVRGGLQVPFAAVKLPLTVLLTAGFATPALIALEYVFGGVFRPRRTIALVLSALAFGTAVLAVLAPIVVLCAVFQISYHSAVTMTVATCLIGGVAGLSLLREGLVLGGVRSLILGVMMLVAIACVGTRMAWVFRPFIARPTAEIALFRPLEGGFLDSVGTTYDSAQGRYFRDAAPHPGER